jgi:hypothetical protein
MEFTGVAMMTNSDAENGSVIHIRTRGAMVEFVVTPFDDGGKGELRRVGAFVGALVAGAINCGCQIILRRDHRLSAR